jgi:hypothetical protein
MKVIKGNTKDIGDFLDFLKNTNKSFTLSTTTNSTSINYSNKYGKYKRVYSDGVSMSRKEFRLQKTIKKEIEENAIKMEKADSNFKHYKNQKIHFFEFDSSVKIYGRNIWRLYRYTKYFRNGYYKSILPNVL